MSQSAVEIGEVIRLTFSRSADPPSSPVSVNGAFKDSQNHSAGIRAPHAIEALQFDSTRLDRYDLGDGTYCSLALAPETTTRPYSMLLHAIELPAMGPGAQISQAWRIYGTVNGSATDAFAAFLVEFGLDVTIDATVARFVAKAHTHSARAGLRWDGGADATRSVQVTQLLRPQEDGSAEISWAYAVDVDRYNQVVARARR